MTGGGAAVLLVLAVATTAWVVGGLSDGGGGPLLPVGALAAFFHLLALFRPSPRDAALPTLGGAACWERLYAEGLG